MGMYTECLLKCRLKKGEKLDSIKAFMNGGCALTKTPRAQSILNSNSYYHHPDTIFSLIGEYLFCRFDLKNYDKDIQEFLEWISDAVDEYDDQCIGWYWYEESERPSLIIMNKGKAVIEH